MQLTFDTTPGINSVNIDNPGDCSAPATPQSNNNGDGPIIERMFKARPNYRGDTADYPKKGY
jgi:hypothetical protein